jgi:hypothetical protein
MIVIRDYDFHPPDDLRLFRMPKSGVLRLDGEAFVAEVRYGDVVVRHYAFRDHWFKVNCTTDLAGRFVETNAPEDVPPFTFNCDLATPMLRRGEAVYAVDLWLDVLVRGDGVTYGVHDHDEFDHATRQGWLSGREAAGARAGLRELVALVEAGGLVAFLADACPFAPSSAPEALAERSVPVQEAPLLHPRVRPSW